MKRSPMKRRGKGLARRGRKAMSPEEERARDRFNAFVYGRAGGLSEVSREEAHRMDQHHCIPKQRLRDDGHPIEVVWDTRNGLNVTRDEHSQHTSRFKPIAFEHLRRDTIEFAEEHGYAELLLTEHPPNEEA